MGKTILVMTNSTVIELFARGILGGAADTSVLVNWTSGYAQGTTNIAISCATNSRSYNFPISVGDMLFLTVEDDTSYAEQAEAMDDSQYTGSSASSSSQSGAGEPSAAGESPSPDGGN